MFEISETISWQVRKRRAYKRLQVFEAANDIGISRQTLRKIESGELKRTTRTVYTKVINWLLEENEVK